MMMPSQTDTLPHKPVAPLVEHFFRHQSGRLVSVLTGIFGWKNFPLVEDMVQESLVDALRSWQTRGVPENPAAWIHAVAKNKVIDALRRDQAGDRQHDRLLMDSPLTNNQLNDLFLDSEIEDSQLRMIFACCHPSLSPENQISLTLKTLCGFSHAEIARALLVSEDAIKKRLQRATQELVDRQIQLDVPAAKDLPGRLTSVHHALYLLFNEGYSSSGNERAIRADLCEEAARLCHLLCQHERFQIPATDALMSLMLFHAARLDSRLDPAGSLLLMEAQNRDRWDHALIAEAQRYLNQSAQGAEVSVYHLEAAIACYHCSAQTYESTDWPAILKIYDALISLHRSPIYLLNRAIVLAEIEGPQAAINALSAAAAESVTKNYHLFDAAMGEFYRRIGKFDQARAYLLSARQKTDSRFDHELIDRRLKQCSEQAVAS